MMVAKLAEELLQLLGQVLMVVRDRIGRRLAKISKSCNKPEFLQFV